MQLSVIAKQVLELLTKEQLLAVICSAPELQSPPVPTGSAIKIVVMQRGWVFVGRYMHDGTNVTLKNARNIRRWGTTNGLGELAEKGIMPETNHDAAGTVSCPALGVIATLDVDDSKWGVICS